MVSHETPDLSSVILTARKWRSVAVCVGCSARHLGRVSRFLRSAGAASYLILGTTSHAVILIAWDAVCAAAVAGTLGEGGIAVWAFSVRSATCIARWPVLAAWPPRFFSALRQALAQSPRISQVPEYSQGLLRLSDASKRPEDPLRDPLLAGSSVQPSQ